MYNSTEGVWENKTKTKGRLLYLAFFFYFTVYAFAVM